MHVELTKSITSVVARRGGTYSAAIIEVMSEMMLLLKLQFCSACTHIFRVYGLSGFASVVLVFFQRLYSSLHAKLSQMILYNMTQSPPYAVATTQDIQFVRQATMSCHVQIADGVLALTSFIRLCVTLGYVQDTNVAL